MLLIRSFYSCLLCLILVLYKFTFPGGGLTGCSSKILKFIPNDTNVGVGHAFLLPLREKSGLKMIFSHVSSRATPNETVNAKNVGAFS